MDVVCFHRIKIRAMTNERALAPGIKTTVFNKTTSRLHPYQASGRTENRTLVLYLSDRLKQFQKVEKVYHQPKLKFSLKCSTDKGAKTGISRGESFGFHGHMHSQLSVLFHHRPPLILLHLGELPSLSIASTRFLAPDPHLETVLRASVKGTLRGCTRFRSRM